MLGSAFINFLFLLLYRHRAKHICVLVMAVIIVTLFSSVMFLSGALQRDVSRTLDDQADFIIQRVRSGKTVDLPAFWCDDFLEITGVTAALPRVHGRYFHEPNGEYFTVVGVDLFDVQTTGNLEELIEGLDMRQFVSRNNMIVGNGVRRFLEDNHYSDSYTFKSPDRTNETVFIYDTFPTDSNLVSNDLIVMEIDLARRVLGVGAEMSTDIVLYVPNVLEGDNVMSKAILKHYDIRVIQKKEIATAYKNLFNYKGGVFLLLYLIVLATFVLILYQRYSMISGSDRREIGILRAVGWSIRDVIALKVAENVVVAVAAFLMGAILAYNFVFTFGAPLLGSVFFGFSNMPVDFALTRSIDLGQLSTLFLFFVLPFIAAVLVPVWRTAIIEPVEAMK